MKKKICALVLGVVMASLLSGCQPSLGLENEYIKIPQYQKVEVPKIADVKEITDEDVENEIEAKRQAAKTTEEITDRAAEQFDTVNIDFVGKKDGVAFEGGTSQGYTLELGSNMFIEGFEDSVIGHKIGETYTWECTFPEDYGNSELAGQDATFDITLNSITVYHVPEVNDEFIQTLSDTAKTVDEYRAELKKQLQEEAEAAHTKELGQAVWDKIAENAEIISLPEEKVEAREQLLMDQYNKIAEEQGVELELVVQSMGYSTVDAFKEAVTEATEKYVTQIVISQSIADKAGIKLTDDVYEAELQKIVDQYGESYGYKTVEEMKAVESEEALRDLVTKTLVVNWLGEHCIQVAN